MTDYHFGLPSSVVWGLHVVVGLFLTYVGMQLLDGMVSRNVALTLLVLGVVATLYHTHLVVYDTYVKPDEVPMKIQEQEQKKEEYYAGRV